MKAQMAIPVLLIAIFGLSVSGAASLSRQEESEIAKEWAGKKADIFFLVDSSSSIWITDFTVMVSFVAGMVEEMDINPYKTRVGLGMFSSRFKEYLPLNNGRDKASLMGAIKDAPYYPGNGYISNGISGVNTIGLSPSVTRKDVPLILVIFTDGESRHKQLTIDNINALKLQNIFIYTIGIGSLVDKNELRTMASDPKDNFAYLVPNFGSLREIKRTLMLNMAKVEFLQADGGSCSERNKADVLFVFDKYSMGQGNASLVNNFIKSVVEDLSLDSSIIRAGIISNTCRSGDVSLVQFLNQKDFIAHLNTEEEKQPSILNLIKKARLNGFLPQAGGRIHAKKRLVLFLHANFASPEYVFDEVLRAVILKIELYIFVIDSKLDKHPSYKRIEEKLKMYKLKSMEELSHYKTQLLNDFCKGANIPATSPVF